MTSNIVGTWTLKSCELVQSDGTISHPLGEHPQGVLVYSDSGHMVVAIQQRGRPSFGVHDVMRGTTDELARAAESYVSYAGRYRVAAGRVFHEVEISLFPNWVGTTQERILERSGERLVLATDPIGIGGSTRVARMIWCAARPETATAAEQPDL